MHATIVLQPSKQLMCAPARMSCSSIATSLTYLKEHSCPTVEEVCGTRLWLQCGHGVIDAKYFLSAGSTALERIVAMSKAGTDLPALGGLGKVWMPGRAKKIYAAPGERGVPYPRAYDTHHPGLLKGRNDTASCTCRVFSAYPR